MTFARQATAQYEPLNHLEIVSLSPISSVVEMPKQQSRLTTLQKWSYGLLVFALLFAGVQAIRCGTLSGAKVDGLLKQLAIVQTVNQEVKERKAVLQDKISLYQSPLGVEEMARERLGMVGQDEILVRIYPTSVAQR